MLRNEYAGGHLPPPLDWWHSFPIPCSVTIVNLTRRARIFISSSIYFFNQDVLHPVNTFVECLQLTYRRPYGIRTCIWSIISTIYVRNAGYLAKWNHGRYNTVHVTSHWTTTIADNVNLRVWFHMPIKLDGYMMLPNRSFNTSLPQQDNAYIVYHRTWYTQPLPPHANQTRRANDAAQ